MKFNGKNIEHKYKAKEYLEKLISKEYNFELKRIMENTNSEKKRTNQQNRSLHLYFKIISDQLNEMGIEFTYTGLKGIEFSIMYTETIFKELFWKPLQMTLFNKASTTELTTNEINKIIDILSKFFAERGVNIAFPSIESLMNNMYNE